MNGSSLVPDPPMNSGSALVFSGSGPTSTTALALSRLISGRRSRRSSRSTAQHSIQRKPDPASSTMLASTCAVQSPFDGAISPSQTPSPSESGFLGSVPLATSSRSDAPSLSSSSSSTRSPSEAS